MSGRLADGPLKYADVRPPEQPFEQLRDNRIGGLSIDSAYIETVGIDRSLVLNEPLVHPAERPTPSSSLKLGEEVEVGGLTLTRPV